MIETDLWKVYKEKGCKEAHKKLVEMHLQLAERIADRQFINTGRSLTTSMKKADFTAAAYMGLLDAMEKFDPEKGFKFSTYAQLRIKGAIIDAYRDDNLLPRSEMMKGTSLTIVSTHHETDDGSVIPLVWQQDFEQDVIKQNDVALIEDCIKKLDEREQFILTEYYLNEQPQKSIGSVLHVSGDRISQIVKSATNKIREMILSKPGLSAPVVKRIKIDQIIKKEVKEKKVMKETTRKTKHDAMAWLWKNGMPYNPKLIEFIDYMLEEKKAG